MITFSRASSGTALAKISYGANLNPAFSNYLIIGTGTWAASGSDYVFEDTAGSQVRPGVSWPTNTLPAGTYRAEIVVASITGATQVRVDGIGGDQLLGVGTHSFVFTTTAISFVRIRIEDTSTTIGDGFAITSVSVRPVLYDQPDGTLQLFNHPTNQPRVEYDAQGNRLGLLVEEARTNVVTYSEDFTQWSQSQVTISANAIEAPDGTLTADKTVEDQTNNYHYAERNFTGVGSYTYSIFVKAAERKYAGIHIYDGSSAKGCSIDLETGTLGTPYGGATASATSFPDGWWRLSVAVTTTGSGKAVVYSSTSNALATYLGDGASGVYIWGAQVEAGSFPTSYIPTAGSTVTRAADVATIGVGAFGYNKTAGSVVVVADTISTSENNHQDFRLTGSVSGNSINSGSRVGSGSAGEYTVWVQTGGTVALLTANDVVSDGAQYKAAYRFAQNDFALSVSGGSVLADSTGEMPVSISTLTLGYGYGYLNGHISSIAYYPRRLTDAQIKALTSPPETPTLSLAFDDSSTSYLETSIHG